MKYALPLLLFMLLFAVQCKKPEETSPKALNLVSVKTQNINLLETTTAIPVGSPILIEFDRSVDPSTAEAAIQLTRNGLGNQTYSLSYINDNLIAVLAPTGGLANNQSYTLSISANLKGRNGETFAATQLSFKTINGQLLLEKASINSQDLLATNSPKDVNYKNIQLELSFSQALNPSDYQSYISVQDVSGLAYTLSEQNKKLTITNTAPLKDYKKYNLYISNNLKSQNGFTFDGLSKYFYTSVDSTNKFPVIADNELLTLVQKQTFRYFWDFGHPISGLARERNTSGDVVTTGGSGFGVMAMVVAMERGFITRSEGIQRLNKIVDFLGAADRFHGAWPHWMNGQTGKVIPFGEKDNGGDLVETSFMVQGLITVRQYLNASAQAEALLIDKINVLLDGVEYDWYTRGQSALYWHWSPNYEWAMNFKLEGYNETLITYVVAAASKSHSIPKDSYTLGFSRNGAIINGRTFYGLKLPLGSDYGGPMFFAHYSYLGMDPRKLKDASSISFWEQNVNHSKINYAYCLANPRGYTCYSKDCWGLTASDNYSGYSTHEPNNDLGVIVPTAALSSFPYTPDESMRALKHFYYVLGNRLWGEYGFYDAFAVEKEWWANSYLAIDQGPIICMIENYRTGLLWNLFMSAPEVKSGLTKLGFTY